MSAVPVDGLSQDALRKWAKSSLIQPLVLGLAAVAAGAGIAVTSAQPARVGVLVLAGLLLGGGLITVSAKRLLTDGEIPAQMVGLSVLLAIGAIVLLLIIKDNSPVYGLMAGLVAGLSLGSAWAIRTIRARLR